MMTKMVTISRQAATAKAVIVVNGDTTCANTPPPVESRTPLPSPVASAPPNSSLPPNSAPVAMRRLPAGDEFMQPPVFVGRGWRLDGGKHVMLLQMSVSENVSSSKQMKM